jgi:hypothetical protein
MAGRPARAGGGTGDALGDASRPDHQDSGPDLLGGPQDARMRRTHVDNHRVLGGGTPGEFLHSCGHDVCDLSLQGLHVVGVLLLELREQHSNMEDLGQHMTHMQPAPGMASPGIRLAHRFVGTFTHVGCDQHRAVR